MNSVSALPLLTLSSASDAPGFIDQCVALGQSIFTRLQSAILSPSDNPAEADADIRNLETASRILKRIQETYLTARKAIETKALPDNISKTEKPIALQPAPTSMAIASQEPAETLPDSNADANQSTAPSPAISPDSVDSRNPSDMIGLPDMPDPSPHPNCPLSRFPQPNPVSRPPLTRAQKNKKKAERRQRRGR